MNKAHDPTEFATEADDAEFALLHAREGAWQADTRGPVVSAQGERQASFRTQSMDWEVEPLYTPLDLAACGFDYARDAGFPGEYPFTRGTEPNGNRTRLWTMAQVTGFGKGMAWATRLTRSRTASPSWN